MVRSTVIGLLLLVSPISAQETLCTALDSLRSQGEGPIDFRHASTIAARVIATSSPDLELYRVTSGSFLEAGRLQVANAGTNQIFILGLDGNIQRRVGRSGPGPGEFVQLHFSHGNERRDGFTAFDMGNRRVSRFDHDGNLVGTWLLPSTELYRYYHAMPLLSGSILAMTRWTPGATSLVPGEVAKRDIPIVRIDPGGDQDPEPIAWIAGQEDVISRSSEGYIRRLSLPFGVSPVWMPQESGCVLWLDGRREAIFWLRVGDSSARVFATTGIDTKIGDREWAEVVGPLGRAFREHHPREDPYRAMEMPERHQVAARLIFDGESGLSLEAFHHRDVAPDGWWRVDLRTGATAWLPAPRGASRMIAADPDGRLAVLTKDHLDREEIVILRLDERERDGL